MLIGNDGVIELPGQKKRFSNIGNIRKVHSLGGGTATETKQMVVRGTGDAEKLPESWIKATRLFRINYLTQKPKPNQTQNKATKSFRFDFYFWNKAKTKPPSA